MANEIDFSKLKEPFPEEDIEWRIQKAGVKDGKPWAYVLAYVTNRAIQERLDDVVGCDRWKNEFKEGPGGGVLCGISIKAKDEWITKWDGAENTQFEAVKGGLSAAMKRAAVHWQIGRYLYKLEAAWAHFSDEGKHRDKIDGTWYRWNHPELPAWALPNGKTKKAPRATKKNEDPPPTHEETEHYEQPEEDDTRSKLLRDLKLKMKADGIGEDSFLEWRMAEGKIDLAPDGSLSWDIVDTETIGRISAKWDGFFKPAFKNWKTQQEK